MDAGTDGHDGHGVEVNRAVGITGTATFQGIQQNDGTLRLGSDTILSVTNYTQSSTGDLQVEIVGTGGPGVDHGQLTGTVSLDGRLTLEPTGSYTPPSQADFVVVSSTGVAADDFTSLADSVATGSDVKEATSLIGSEGQAVTALRPAGVASFGGRRYDVMTRGGFVEPGVRVTVVETSGNRILVKPL